jgi:PAS domain S-box-containing protein
MSGSPLKTMVKRNGIVLVVIWTVIIAVLIGLAIFNQRQDTLKSATDEGRDYFRLNLFYRAWGAKMGGLYVATDKVTPNPYLTVPNRDVTTTDGRQLTMVNPAYMSRMVFEMLRAESPDPIISRLISTKPLNPANLPDAWESASLQAIERGEISERSEVAMIDGRPYLRLLSKFVTEEPCLKCHAHQGYKKGDIRGGITIAVPLTRRYQLAAATERRIAGGYLLLWAWGSGGIVFMSRRRWRDEEQLRQSERKFRTVCDWTQDWEYWISPSGSFNYISPSSHVITGYTPAEFMSDPHLLQRIIHPADQALFEEHHRKNVAQQNDHVDHSEFRIVTRQGETRWLEHLCRPVYEDGEYLGRRVSNRDITAQKQAAEKISRLSAIVEYSDDAIISKDLAGLVTSWNHGAERLFGYTEQEVLGKMMLSLLPPDRQHEEQTILDAMARGESIEHFETIRVTKDGTHIDVSVTLSPIRDDAGTIVGFSKVARDISARKKAAEERLNLERQLLQTQKLESLGVLAGGIAHDFNNILTAIIGHTDLALMRLNKESPVVENLRRVLDAATRAADLARQMLAYSGKGKFVIEDINLNVLVEEMTHMLEVSISKKVVLRFNRHQPLPAVAVDATQIRQIIMNLVINASDAIGDKSGVIAITTGCMECDRDYLASVWLDEQMPEGLYVWLEVADTGCGMDKATVGRIFDPFFTTKFTGRGLGMAAVLGIVRGHQGAIKVYSEVGKGSTFKVLLPASTHPAELFNTGDEGADSNWQGSGAVLLVDDEETVLGIGAEMLKALGFEVIVAQDGRQGLDIYRANRQRIVCVILDLTMPHLDGEQTFRELRRLQPDVKVIMSSGYNEHEVTQRFIGKGLAGFIQKPYKLSTLRDTLAQVLPAS